MDTAEKIRLALNHGGEAVAMQCIDLALAAAREAGVKALKDVSTLSPVDQLAVALGIVAEALEELAVGLSDEGPEGEGAAGGATS